jgi:ribulose-bisphosphate carboxylase large chain
MIVEHGTAKPWEKEGPADLPKPPGYDSNLARVEDLGLYGRDESTATEEGCLSVAYPLSFFDKAERGFPLAQLLMACASEPASAFSFYRSSRVVDIRIPSELARRLPPPRWPHRRVRSYLGLAPEEPIIGTIIKPKTGLTPELFSRSVVDAAVAGARFTKADENCHLTRRELGEHVGQTVRDLEREGFDLSPGVPGRKPRFLFAPHITSDPPEILERARAAVEAGANALMFSPYYSGGFSVMAGVASALDVPLYAHTAGMNQLTGFWGWGFDPSVMYVLAALLGAAFMQLTCVSSYLRPLDVEKPFILRRLEEERLVGDDGMTLVIAGGLAPGNIGANAAALGWRGRMFLAGTSVYSHPAGPRAGVEALVGAFRAYRDHGITDPARLYDHARALGRDGLSLAQSLEQLWR